MPSFIITCVPAWITTGISVTELGIGKNVPSGLEKNESTTPSLISVSLPLGARILNCGTTCDKQQNQDQAILLTICSIHIYLNITSVFKDFLSNNMGTIGAICCCEKQWKGKQKGKHLHKVAKAAKNKEKEEEMCLLCSYNQNCERSGECTMVCNEDSISSQ